MRRASLASLVAVLALGACSSDPGASGPSTWTVGW